MKTLKKNQQTRRRVRSGGFTLMELMVAVGVMALGLSAVALMSATASQQVGRSSAYTDLVTGFAGWTETLQGVTRDYMAGEGATYFGTWPGCATGYSGGCEGEKDFSCLLTERRLLLPDPVELNKGNQVGSIILIYNVEAYCPPTRVVAGSSSAASTNAANVANTYRVMGDAYLIATEIDAAAADGFDPAGGAYNVVAKQPFQVMFSDRPESK